MSNIDKFVLSSTPIKFFAIDIDQTFYVEDQEVFDRNKKSLKLLKSKGKLPFFCTSRCYCSAMTLLGDSFVRDTGYDGFPGIYANGCCVFDEYGNTVFQKTFSKEFLDKYVKYIFDNKIQSSSIFETAYNSLILTEPNNHIKRNVEIKNMHQPRQTTLEEVYRSEIVCVRHIKNGIEIPDLENGKDYVCNIYGNVVTLNPPGVTKDVGLQMLLEHKNGTPKECGYIGDGENDIPGFKLCETSFAVFNAKNKVKQEAKWVLDLKYDEGAFEKAVKLLCSV